MAVLNDNPGIGIDINPVIQFTNISNFEPQTSSFFRGHKKGFLKHCQWYKRLGPILRSIEIDLLQLVLVIA